MSSLSSGVEYIFQVDYGLVASVGSIMGLNVGVGLFSGLNACVGLDCWCRVSSRLDYWCQVDSKPWLLVSGWFRF